MTLGKYIFQCIFYCSHTRPLFSLQCGIRKQTMSKTYRQSLRNASLWHMTLTAGCWKTDFLLYPTDICLSPHVCSCTDQVVEDVSQMLDCLLTRLSYPTLQLIRWLFLAMHPHFKNKSHTFGIRIPYDRTLLSQSLHKKQNRNACFSITFSCVWRSDKQSFVC